MNLLGLIVGISCIASGSMMLIFPRRTRLAAKAKSEDRKAELDAGASERFFEEGRALSAYPLLKTDGKWRARGMLLTVGGIVLLGLSLYR